MGSFGLSIGYCVFFKHIDVQLAQRREQEAGFREQEAVFRELS